MNILNEKFTVNTIEKKSEGKNESIDVSGSQAYGTAGITR